jgi:hypothetical protein
MSNNLDNGGSTVSITRSNANNDRIALQINNQNLGTNKKSGGYTASDKPIATSIAEELRKQYPKKD